MQLLLRRWRDPESGLDSAEASTYEVLLSFPSQEQPNHVAIGEVPPRWLRDACGEGSCGAHGQYLGHIPRACTWSLGCRLDGKLLTPPPFHSGSQWDYPLLLSPERREPDWGAGGA